MKLIKANIQNGWMKRVGIRGRFVTFYHHSYNGTQEVTERYHRHPWKITISIVYKGGFQDQIEGNDIKKRYPKFGIIPSVAVYFSNTKHRLKNPLDGTRSIFVGLFRQQTEGSNATVKYPEGYGHYTETSGNINDQ